MRGSQNQLESTHLVINNSISNIICKFRYNLSIPLICGMACSPDAVRHLSEFASDLVECTGKESVIGSRKIGGTDESKMSRLVDSS